ncbi:MAG TPA: alkaline phosphatase PhoX [Myxococcaceae bacterium]|nr:alkaline phosphatase PhoX [Myxococcaceae bacterium]
MSRRTLLRAGATLALPYVLGRCATPESKAGLLPDPAGILDLPEGFTYRVLERRGDAMDDGFRVPGSPDGMGVFPGEGNTLVLMRNHELNPGQESVGPYSGQPPAQMYRPEDRSPGGVTRLVVDATTFDRVSSNLVLVGSSRNCAGGHSPWGWLTCEENMATGHGYVFLCDPAASTVQPPVRIPALGRRNHEAAVTDPSTLVTYLTEDRGDSCFYRFVPEAPGERLGPSSRGRLQALSVVGEPRRDMNRAKAGDTFEAGWVDLPRPDAEDDSLRAQGADRGAAIFRRGEGIYLHQGAVYFCATTGGPANGGQIWRYMPSGPDGGALHLLAQSEDRSELDMPDNLCVAPWGDVVLAEDGDDARWPNEFLRILTPSGQVKNLARNALSSSEWAGVCFSPDGRALFVNMQADGITVVITGPFQAYTGTR